MVTKPTIWPQGRFGVPQITPYTYRDGQTLLELITALRDHVVEQLHPNLQKAIDQLVVDVETEYGKAHDRYVDGVQEFQRIHDAFMSDVNAHLIALNDGAITDIVSDETSLLGQTLRTLFPDVAALKAFETTMEGRHHAYEIAQQAQGQRLDNLSDTIQDVSDRQPVVYLTDYGYTPDNPSTHTTALQEAINVASTTGKTLVMPHEHVLNLDRVIILPSNVTIDGNDSVLTWATSPDTWLMTANTVNHVTITNLHIDLPDTIGANQRGILFRDATNITLDGVTLTYDHGVLGRGGIRENAVRFERSKDLTLNRLSVRGWSFALCIAESTRVHLNDLEISVFRTGVQLWDVQQLTINGGHIHTNDESTLENLGGLGVLIETRTEHHPTRHVVINDVHVEDSGSHGFRIGGQLPVHHVTYNRCTVTNTTRGGFKTLGGTLESGSRHRHIQYHDCKVFDCAQDGINAGGFQIELTDDVVVSNPVVAARNKTYSTQSGVAVTGAHRVSVINPSIHDTYYAGISIRGALGSIDDLSITGGEILATKGDAIFVDMGDTAIRRLRITGHPSLQTRDSSRHIFVLNMSNVPGNSLITGYVPYSNMTMFDPWSKAPVLGDIIGPWSVQAGNNTDLFRAGSIWRDITKGGILRIKRGNHWLSAV